MSSTDDIITLRKLNKDLLMQLRNQTKILEKITNTSLCLAGTATGCDGGRELNTVKVNDKSADLATRLSIVDSRGHARRALGQTLVLWKENTASTNDQPTATGLHENRDNQSHSKQPDSSKHSPQSILLDHDRERRESISGVTFQSPELETLLNSDRHNMQPLLGYDWIAGVLDAESSLTERSEDFYDELREFRQKYKDDCVHSLFAGISEEGHSGLSLFREKEEAQPDKDTHQCTFCYRINSRLFATPIDPQESCPICRMPKSKHPHTTTEPANIRVSIPRSALLPAYKYKAHRRCSFDPSDNIGLPSHCLSGWSNPCQTDIQRPSSLDLRSSLTTETPITLPSAQPLDHQQGLSVSRVSGSCRRDLPVDLSCLARYRFQHFFTSWKRPNMTEREPIAHT